VEVKLLLRALVDERADLVRGLLLVLIFRPAAYLLPRSWIWPVALCFATLFVVLMADGRRLAREFGLIFGVSRSAALKLAITSHAKRMNEFSLQQKMIARTYRPFEVPVLLEASDEVRRIIEGPGSFVLAQAHFERGTAQAAVFNGANFDGRELFVVAVKVPRFVPMPHIWRIGLQLRQLTRASQAIRPKGMEFVYTGGAVTGLVEKLQHERIMVSINVDAHWSRNRSSTLERPFCGALKRSFSTGAAKLARLANAPLMLALPVFDAHPGQVRLRMYGPYTSDAAIPEQRDTEISQKILDTIEREVGVRPCEYVLEIGAARRWDNESHRWLQPPPVAMEVQAPGVTS